MIPNPSNSSKEIADKIVFVNQEPVGHMNEIQLAKDIALALDQAISKEREACLKLVESYKEFHIVKPTCWHTVLGIADAIRKRST